MRSNSSISASACSAKVVALFSSAACLRLLGLSVPLRWRSAHVSLLWPAASHGCHIKRRPVFLCRQREARFCHCHAGLLWSAMSDTPFTQVPVSQRLKPQSSMTEQFRTSPFASAAQRICRSLSTQGRRTSSSASPSRQERVGSHQPPNPSFKRTRLRRSA